MNNKVSNFLEPEKLAPRAGARVVEGLLEEIWPKVFSSLHILAWAPTAAAGVQPYVEAMRRLLDAHLSWFETTQKDRNAYNALADRAKLLAADLVICLAYQRAWLGGRVTRSLDRSLIDTLPVSVLLPIMPRWPLKRILLAIQDHDFDEIAIVWAIRLAKASGAHVTILPVISPAPVVYSQMEAALPALLNSDCALGRKLRWAARRLVEWKIESTIHLRREIPGEQIRCEIVEGDHDLIVIPVEPRNLFDRWLLGELISPLLNWADRPILIAKPKLEAGAR
ncbi:MAG: universal stress protein [Anaerolineales bacterium]|nr:universal stress protein [Anaerolineales bacterium]